jgi:1,4-dihydroxy-2-naphthoyl-CoA synthase
MIFCFHKRAIPMQAAFVTRHDAQGLATLTLNRPDKLNALSPQSFVDLRTHLDAIASDDTIGCVLLQGAGRSFCAGHDLSTIRADMDEAFAAETIDALARLPQPTVARIHGHCLTGGLELALGCDILVASESAKLGDTHGQWGLVPAWGMSVRLPQRVGRSAAKELMFTSRRISARQALKIGLVDHCLPETEIDAAIASLVAEILANSAGTNRIVKALLAAADERTHAAALEFERTLPFGLPADMAQRMGRTL